MGNITQLKEWEKEKYVHAEAQKDKSFASADLPEALHE
jgi:hypothetical protein